MELSELRHSIAQSKNREHFNNLEFDFQLSKSDIDIKFKGFYNLFKYFQNQLEGWMKLMESRKFPNCLNDSVNYFQNAYNQLNEFVNNYHNSAELTESSFKSYLGNYINGTIVDRDYALTFDHPNTTFLLGLNNVYPRSVKSAYDMLIGNNFNINEKDSFMGVVWAYEYINKDKSEIFSRREAEKRSLSKLRNDIETLSDDYNNSLIEHIGKVSEDYESYKDNLDNFEIRSEESLSQWMITHKGNFESFHKESEAKIKSLETQYGELLQLQEPVKYWNDRAKELNSRANKMLWLLGGITLVAVVLTYGLLWFTPEGMLESIFKGDTTAAIRWSIIFAIFISFVAFLFRAIMKYMFSNYHLARDAEEREKLTYLYISLLSKGDFSEDERKIVMQSLFSRSDTGLLKEDSSPTMPGISSIFKGSTGS
ncbi:TPA: DUF6161 domain-containing protein [Elizabethkingia anophelis]|uniref:DUF6161 domain-containing protein n=1 Tax=Elizabethkingia anophelis TaxID=1117645 RepID=UPI0020B7AD69|nr:DUF6161 domain-containing protein [Elizabethkingia anophelis]UTG59843.1 hypothetical protein J2O09_10415 [Elizabethkingia anophelis]UXM66030.1 DUF6161 domain-containing protein [Elizabethkingia anophelis]